jgi:hypothetical protein
METTNNTPEETTASSNTREGKVPSGATIAVIAVLLVGLLGAGYLYLNRGESGFSLGSLLGGGEQEAVARVNGETITRAEYEESLATMRSTLEAQGADLTNAELQAQIDAQVLETLINTELLTQAALKGNFAADSTAVQTEYDAITAQLGGAEALQLQLASVGLTEEELRSDIGKQLGIRAYLAANIATSSLAVSEDEIVAFYDSVELPADQKPTLEEVRAQIEEQLRAGKEQGEIAKLIQILRAEADIEVLI